MNASHGKNLAVLALPLASVVFLFVARLTGPDDLMDNDQQRPANYVMDLLVNDHWIVQTDHQGEVMSKPPGSTWLRSLMALPWDRPTGLSLRLPSLACLLGTVLLILIITGRIHGSRAALLAGIAISTCPLASRLVFLVRTDPLFGLLVFAAGLAAWRAWSEERSFLPFWALAALATLTKGPLVLPLAGAGLLAWFWERRDGARLSLRRGHLTGIVLFLVLCGGWFLAAHHQLGDALTDKMLGRELLAHSVGGENGQVGDYLVRTPLYFLLRFFPWSLLALLAAIRVIRCGGPPGPRRRLERFLVCQLLGGLALLSCGAHMRPDLLWPLLPGAAVLAGVEAARLLGRVGDTKVLVMAGAAVVINAVLAHLVSLESLERDHDVARTVATQAVATAVLDAVGPRFPLVHVDTPFALQYWFSTAERRVSVAAAAAALRSDLAVFVMINEDDVEDVEGRVGEQVELCHLLDPGRVAAAGVALVANRGALARSDDLGSCRDGVFDRYRAPPEPFSRTAGGVVLGVVAVAVLLALFALGLRSASPALETHERPCA